MNRMSGMVWSTKLIESLRASHVLISFSFQEAMEQLRNKRKEMSDRKLVKDQFDCLSWSIENQTVDYVIEHLKKERDKILSNPKYKSAEIAFYPGDPYDNSDKEYAYVVGIREENDKEYNERIEIERKNNASREEYEKKQFEFLKKKYEGK